MVALMVLALPTACVDDLAPDYLIDERVHPVVPAIDSITITATMEQGVTKSALTSTLDVVWSSGDQIKVYNASNPGGKVFTLKDECDGQAVGLFDGEALTGEGPFYAVYPASAAGSLDNGRISVSVPNYQDYADNTFSKGANITTAIASSIDKLYFKNAFGMLAVTLKGDVDISELVVINDNGEPLNGDAFITPSMEGDPVLTWNPQGAHSSQAELISTSLYGTSLSDEGTVF